MSLSGRWLVYKLPEEQGDLLDLPNELFTRSIEFLRPIWLLLVFARAVPIISIVQLLSGDFLAQTLLCDVLEATSFKVDPLDDGREGVVAVRGWPCSQGDGKFVRYCVHRCGIWQIGVISFVRVDVEWRWRCVGGNS